MINENKIIDLEEPKKDDKIRDDSFQKALDELNDSEIQEITVKRDSEGKITLWHILYIDNTITDEQEVS